MNIFLKIMFLFSLNPLVYSLSYRIQNIFCKNDHSQWKFFQNYKFCFSLFFFCTPIDIVFRKVSCKDDHPKKNFETYLIFFSFYYHSCVLALRRYAEDFYAKRSFLWIFFNGIQLFLFFLCIPIDIVCWIFKCKKDHSQSISLNNFRFSFFYYLSCLLPLT